MTAKDQQKALKAAIGARRFAPVYYFHGEEDFRKSEATRQLVDAAVDPATRDFNLEIRRGSETDAGTLGSMLSMPPMMAERRVVVVRDVGALKKDARAQLERYLADPSRDTVLVLVALAGTKPDEALLSAATAVEFEQISGEDLNRWVARHVSEMHGGTITPEAVALLVNAVGADLSQLAVEIEKLASFARSGSIGPEAVSAVVGVRHGETMGDLLDAVARRDAASSVALVPRILEQPNTSAVQVVMALATQTLGIAWGRARRDRGVPARALSRELFDLLKQCRSVYPGRSWGEAVACWAQGAERWSAAELDEALAHLLETDRVLKDTRISNDEQILTSLVLRLCASRGARTAA